MKRFPSKPIQLRAKAQGFSLLEVAVVLVIMGMLLSSLIVPLSAQRESKQRAAAEDRLLEIRQALLGFLLVNGRFPCPAAANSNGAERRNAGTGACLVQNGYVPNATLGLSGDYTSAGLLADPWSFPYRYSLSGVNSWEYSNSVSLNSSTPDIQVCSAASCGANQVLTTSAVAIVFSTAKLGTPAANSPSELENTDNDSIFVKANLSSATGGEFDDVVLWLSQYEVAYALMKSGYVY